MPRVDPPTQESADLEAALRRQLRWIEDDVTVTLLGPETDPGGKADEAAAAAPGRRTLLSRLRHWTKKLLRRSSSGA